MRFSASGSFVSSSSSKIRQYVNEPLLNASAAISAPAARVDAAGTYIISYEAVPEFVTPAVETKTLPAGGSILFKGTYTEQTGPILRAIGSNKSTRRIGSWTLFVLLFGLVLAGVGAWSNWIPALLWSAACSAIGWVLGFLFGIPRTLQTEGQSEVTHRARNATR